MRSLYRIRGTDKAYCLRIGRTAVSMIVTSAPYNDNRNIREDLKRPRDRTHPSVTDYRRRVGPGAFPERLTGEDAGQHYAAMIESSADAILSKVRSGVIMSWNPRRGAPFLVIPRRRPWVSQ